MLTYPPFELMAPAAPHLRLVANPPEDRKLQGPSGEPLRVLIVEDDAMVAATLADIVEESGGYVAGAMTSGLASVGAAAGTRPDVIVMDVGLPGMDGIDAAAIIRSRSPMPIVFISGRDIREELTRRLGRDLSGVEILLKPIDRDPLCEAVLRALSRSTPG
ncbi:MAG TPA: response regulator [Novosphingobium sp.]|jgi:CheY-like chemotaxis protein|nr:response regulator [Novosphingobium sp.]